MLRYNSSLSLLRSSDVANNVVVFSCFLVVVNIDLLVFDLDLVFGLCSIHYDVQAGTCCFVSHAFVCSCGLPLFR
jgi:hypothetical protein